MSTNLQLLQHVGTALYGPRWQTALATQLHVSDRTMRRWMAGDSPVPDGVVDDLRRVVAHHAAEISHLNKTLGQSDRGD